MNNNDLIVLKVNDNFDVLINDYYDIKLLMIGIFFL